MKENLERNQQTNHRTISKRYTNTTKLAIGAIYTALATMLQSAGGFTGIGYALSILTTLPILMSSLLSIRIGLLSYSLTMILLWIFQPSELIIFPFTTGLLGITLGFAFKRWKGWFGPVTVGGIGLTIGILFLLYILRFPVLGPSISNSFNLTTALIILLFSFVYSLIWVGLIKKFISQRLPFS